MCASFPFCFEGGMLDLIVFVPDQYLYFYLTVGLSVCPSISHSSFGMSTESSSKQIA